MAAPSSHRQLLAIVVALVTIMIVILAVSWNEGRKELISRFRAPVTATPTFVPQAAQGLVGSTSLVTPTLAPSPSPTAAPTASSQPLSGVAIPQPTPAPQPSSPPSLSGVGLPRTPDPNLAADLIAAGSALQFAGACVDAIPLYKRAITADPSFSNVYSQLALCLYDQGRVDEAIVRWREALERDPLSPDALAGLGTALYRKGEQEGGLASYRQAISLDPRYADEIFLRAETLWGGSAIIDSRPLRGQPGL
jgi:hypothetical protein